jgi:3-oxoacyl-[acyl-carrier protein] reductase
VVERFVREGALVAAVYHSERAAPEGVALSLAADVSEEGEVERLMGAVHERLGGPDILLNLVGGWAGGQKAPELDKQVWDHMLSLNLTSAFLCSKHALRYMLPSGYGRIANVASKSAFDLGPGVAAYAVAKAGVVSLTGCIAKEVKGTGVSVACVAPSSLDTEKNRASMSKIDPAKFVRPEQIAETLAWLASDGGGAANGAIVPLYGAL